MFSFWRLIEVRTYKLSYCVEMFSFKSSFLFCRNCSKILERFEMNCNLGMRWDESLKNSCWRKFSNSFICFSITSELWIFYFYQWQAFKIFWKFLHMILLRLLIRLLKDIGTHLNMDREICKMHRVTTISQLNLRKQRHIILLKINFTTEIMWTCFQVFLRVTILKTLL